MNMPERLRRNVLRWFLGGLILTLGSACVEPPGAVNEVSTEHTVTITFPTQPYYDLISEEDGDYPDDLQLGPFPVDQFVRFRVISGPNAGLQSTGDNDCVPACNDPDENHQISWTYRSNGVPGTDRIEVCVKPDWIDLELTSEDIQRLEQEFDAIANSFDSPYNGEAVLLFNSVLPQLVNGPDLTYINEDLGTDFDDVEDLLCETVEKTWEPVEPTPETPRLNVRPPNIGAGLSGLFQGQPTPLPTASAPAPEAPSRTIRPPSTGDAGLAVRSD